ncbi:MAG TPA: right-handed parallel beta-helix repeat-containing protein, partial [Polyangiaceae bacterium]|nr:right-handed parallel beta-helix repeat-containing protein [Polyangiaceae bacterium]
GFEWLEAKPEFAAGCTPTEWQLYADRDLDGRFDAKRDVRLLAVAPPLLVGKPDTTLYPGVTLRPINPNPFRGRVRSDVEAQTYYFFVRSAGCSVKSLSLVGRNAVTTAAVGAAAAGTQIAPEREAMTCEDRAGFIEPGSKSLHPFCYPIHAEETIHLGPGVVELAKTRIFNKNQTVVIEPGTTIRADKAASIIAYGKVIAEGRPDAKIQFVGRDGHWGGVALQGPGTTGSRFSNVEFLSPTRPEHSFFDFPGALNVHDTRDVRLSAVRFADNEKSDDALHAAYVDGLELSDVTFDNIRADAVDLEHTIAQISRMRVNKAGDDAIDLMGSRVQVTDSLFVKCAGNGLSVGEQSEVSVARSVVARGARAILLKNASQLSVSELLSYGNEAGIRLENESLWYVGSSNLNLSGTHVVKSKQAFDGSQSTTKGVLIERLNESDLPDLRRDVMKIEDWNSVDQALDRLEQRRQP